MANHGLVGSVVLVSVSSDIRTRIAAHAGEHNQSVVGSRLPMIVTRQWGPDCVNGTLFVDGEAQLWMTSVQRGVEPGEFVEQ